MLSRVAKVKSVKDMPSPKGLPFVGTAVSLMAAGSSKRLHKYIDNRHKQLGPLFKESIGPIDCVFVSDPDVMRTVLTKLEGKHPTHVLPQPWTVYNDMKKCKRGLFFMDGEEWLHYRRILNKLLLVGDAKTWLETPISRVAANFVQKWKTMAKTTEGYYCRPDIEKDLYKVSLDVMVAVMLGSAYESKRRDVEDLLVRFSEQVHNIFLYTSKMYLLPAHYYANLNMQVWKNFTKSIDDSLLLGKQLVDALYASSNHGDGLFSKMIGEEIHRDMITRLLIDFVIAAGDTTSFTTQWCLYLLAKNPYIIDKFHQSDKSQQNSLIKNAIKETMRLYPAAAFLTRFLPNESNLAGFDVPAGTLVVMSVYTSGRDERNFSNPLRFNPDRWDKGVADDRVFSAHATIPFAMGARSCIGRQIALIQIKETVSELLSNFRLKLLNKSDVEDEMQMVLKPMTKIDISFTPRV